jgi:hypothetical protein
MLEKLSDVPNSVLGFRASGELTGDDYRNVLVPGRSGRGRPGLDRKLTCRPPQA